jgi:uncharacterized protein with GYD domain
MATFIYLINFTDEGIKGMADAPARRAQAEKMVGDLGGKIQATWLTSGIYDRIVVVDFPDGDAAAKFAIGLSKRGHARTTTLRGWDAEAAEAIIAGAP